LRVINIVERIMRRRLLLQIRDSWNAADITFANSVRAVGFHPMGISEGAAVTFVMLEQPGLVDG
jgi:hypothetical protein